MCHIIFRLHVYELTWGCDGGRETTKTTARGHKLVFQHLVARNWILLIRHPDIFQACLWQLNQVRNMIMFES